MAVGAPGQRGHANDRGKLWVYRYDIISDTWDVLGNKENMVGDIAIHPNSTRNSELGYSVALSEDGSIVAGTTRHNDQNGYQTDAIKIFQYQSDANEWAPLGPPIQGAAEDDRLGWRVAMSADGKIVAGSQSKRVVVYGYFDIANEWVQLGQKLESDNPKDSMGFSLDISADGKVLAASTRGRVWVFWYNAEMKMWLPLGKHGEFVGDTEGDRFGRSVRLSANGRILACSASGVEGNSSSGYVRVYHGV